MYTRWRLLDTRIVILDTGRSDMRKLQHNLITGLQTHSWLVNCHPTLHSQLSVDLKAASARSRSQVKRHGLSNYCRDVVVPCITCESIPGSPPPFRFFVGTRGEPGNEAGNEARVSHHLLWKFCCVVQDKSCGGLCHKYP